MPLAAGRGRPTGTFITEGPELFGQRVGVNLWPPPQIYAEEFDNMGLNIKSLREPLTRAVRQVMIPRFKQNFSTESAAGERWQPLSYYYERSRKYKGKPILVQTGALKRVATRFTKTWTINGISGQAYINVGSIQNEVPYLLLHQLGEEYYSAGGSSMESDTSRRAKKGKGFVAAGGPQNVPARPFFVINGDDVDAVADVFDEWVTEIVWMRGGITSIGGRPFSVDSGPVDFPSPVDL